jgi:hypothetical protein
MTLIYGWWKVINKDPMEVIKALEKTYMLKSVGIPEYNLCGNVELFGEAWKNQGLGFAISAKNLHLERHSEI